MATQNTAVVEAGLFSISRAAEYTSRSATTVKRWLNAGDVPYCRIGGARLIPKRALDEFLVSRLVSKSAA